MGLADLGRRHLLTTPVPTCGDWTLGDLLWHLAEVQDFWVFVVANRPNGPDSYVRPDRPPDGELADMLVDRCTGLLEELAGSDPADTAWSWSADQTVGFTLRRQTHEALIHHVDGLLAVGEPVPDVDPTDAADGVDELVGVMLTGIPEWADFEPATETLRVVTTDVPGTWSLIFGRMTGTSPTSGTDYDIDATELIDELDAPSTTISGCALDLDLWLWGRRDASALTVAGDPAGAHRLRTQVTESTQ